MLPLSGQARPAPSWTAIKGQELVAAAPPTAGSGPGGRAAVECHVEDNGALSGCQVIRETPVGEGYGQALLSLTPNHRQAPPGPNDPRQFKLVADWFKVDAPTDWAKKPEARDLLAVYPKAARGVDGSAVIDCLVTIQGALNDCLVLSESPAGSGFGGAGIALAPQFMMRPVKFKGAPTQTTVSIPIDWKGWTDHVDTFGSKSVMPANLPWAEAPTFADVAAAYPKKAREEKKAGHAAVTCEMSEEGRLVHCVGVSAQPSGYGFEGAAKDLAKHFRFNVSTPEDRKATHNVVVHMPFTFDPTTLDEATPVIGRPTWSVIPTDAQFTASLGVLKLTQTARASISCVVLAAGGLSDCALVAEQPSGAGVGAAALALAPAFRLSTWTTEGLPVVGGRVIIPLRYEPPAQAPQ